MGELLRRLLGSDAVVAAAGERQKRIGIAAYGFGHQLPLAYVLTFGAEPRPAGQAYNCDDTLNGLDDRIAAT